MDEKVIDGINAVNNASRIRETCIWTYLRNHPPPRTFRNDPDSDPDGVFCEIFCNMQHAEDHTSWSYSWTVQQLYYIAVHGMDAYILNFESISESESESEYYYY